MDPYAGRNLKVFDSRNVAICEMEVRNNLMVKRSTGRVMVRDNRFTRNVMIERNTVENMADVRNNVDTGQSVTECRASLLEGNGL